MLPRRRNEFDLFDEMFNDPFFTRGESKLMKTDIKEKGDKYLIDIDLPGYDKKDIKIEIEDGYLTVHADINRENDENHLHRTKLPGTYHGIGIQGAGKAGFLLQAGHSAADPEPAFLHPRFQPGTALRDRIGLTNLQGGQEYRS